MHIHGLSHHNRHWIALHFIALDSWALNYILHTLYCTPLHCTPLPCISRYSPALHFSPLNWSSLNFYALHGTALFPLLHYTGFLSISMHWHFILTHSAAFLCSSLRLISRQSCALYCIAFSAEPQYGIKYSTVYSWVFISTSFQCITLAYVQHSYILRCSA
jgi:hypothetical protein